MNSWSLNIKSVLLYLSDISVTFFVLLFQSNVKCWYSLSYERKHWLRYFLFLLTVKPRVKSNVSRPYYVLEGQTATLKCTVIAANPNTSLQWIWYKTNSSSILEENTYIIYEITRKESGSYGCAANNSVGTSETAEIVVDVQCKYCQLKMFDIRVLE